MKAGFIGCGIGMLAKSMKDAGIEIAYGIDNNEKNLADFRDNFPEAQSILEDIRDIELLPRSDIVAITLPCQSFSHANQNRKENPELIWYALYLMARNKPKYWFIENVPNLAKYLPRNLRITEINANDYGNKQKRKRIFVGNFNLPLREFTAKKSEPTVTNWGTGNLKVYGTRTSKQMLQIMGFDKILIVTGAEGLKKLKIAEGVAYEVGYAIGRRLVELERPADFTLAVANPLIDESLISVKREPDGSQNSQQSINGG